MTLLEKCQSIIKTEFQGAFQTSKDQQVKAIIESFIAKNSTERELTSIQAHQLFVNLLSIDDSAQESCAIVCKVICEILNLTRAGIKQTFVGNCMKRLITQNLFHYSNFCKIVSSDGSYFLSIAVCLLTDTKPGFVTNSTLDHLINIGSDFEPVSYWDFTNGREVETSLPELTINLLRALIQKKLLTTDNINQVLENHSSYTLYTELFTLLGKNATTFLTAEAFNALMTEINGRRSSTDNASLIELLQMLMKYKVLNQKIFIKCIKYTNHEGLSTTLPVIKHLKLLNESNLCLLMDANIDLKACHDILAICAEAKWTINQQHYRDIIRHRNLGDLAYAFNTIAMYIYPEIFEAGEPSHAWFSYERTSTIETVVVPTHVKKLPIDETLLLEQLIISEQLEAFSESVTDLFELSMLTPKTFNDIINNAIPSIITAKHRYLVLEHGLQICTIEDLKEQNHQQTVAAAHHILFSNRYHRNYSTEWARLIKDHPHITALDRLITDITRHLPRHDHMANAQFWSLSAEGILKLIRCHDIRQMHAIAIEYSNQVKLSVSQAQLEAARQDLRVMQYTKKPAPEIELEMLTKRSKRVGFKAAMTTGFPAETFNNREIFDDFMTKYFPEHIVIQKDSKEQFIKQHFPMRIFSDKKITQKYLTSITGCLQEILLSPRDISYFIETFHDSLTYDHWNEVIAIARDKVDCLEDCSIVASSHTITKEQRYKISDAVYTKLANRIDQDIGNAYDFNTFTYLMQPENVARAFEQLLARIPEIVKSAQDLIYIMTDSITPDQSARIMLALDDRVMSLCNSSQSAHLVMKHASKENKIKIYQKQQHQFYAWTTDKESFKLFTDVLPIEQKVHYCNQVIDKVLCYIRTVTDLVDTLQSLPSTMDNGFIIQWADKIKSLILSRSDKQTLLSLCTTSKTGVFEAYKPIVEFSKGLFAVIAYLPDSMCLTFIQSFENEFIAILKHHEPLKFAMRYFDTLSSEKIKLIFDYLHSLTTNKQSARNLYCQYPLLALPLQILAFNDLVYILKNSEPAKRRLLYVQYKKVLCSMISSIADIYKLSQLLSKTDYLDFLQHLSQYDTSKNSHCKLMLIRKFYCGGVGRCDLYDVNSELDTFEDFLGLCCANYSVDQFYMTYHRLLFRSSDYKGYISTAEQLVSLIKALKPELLKHFLTTYPLEINLLLCRASNPEHVATFIDKDNRERFMTMLAQAAILHTRTIADFHGRSADQNQQLQQEMQEVLSSATVILNTRANQQNGTSLFKPVSNIHEVLLTLTDNNVITTWFALHSLMTDKPTETDKVRDIIEDSKIQCYRNKLNSLQKPASIKVGLSMV